MRIRLLLLLIVIFGFAQISYGRKISKQEARKAAVNWVKENHELLKPNKDGHLFEVAEIKSVTDRKDKVLFYVVRLIPRGFLVLSSDDELKPVLAYSSESNFNLEERTENFGLSFLKGDVALRLKLLEEKKARIEKLNNNKTEWQRLLSKSFRALPKVKDAKEIYGPFLNSTWGQAYVHGEPVFNYYTPHNWPAGCVATAMAQILNYYKWPIRGYGYHSYSDDDGSYRADFGNTYYDWENTLDDYENVLFNSKQQKAAGLLTFHAAVSVNMDFEYNGSTASTSDAPYGFRHYFRFSGHYSSVSSSGFWTALKNNMIDGRPAILSIKRSDGMGHAAVVDGYAEVNGYYHLNPGWYGSNTGWYDITGSWNMGGYTIVTGAAKGIVPSPMINDIQRIDSLDFYVSWSTSRHQKADYYQLQQATSYGGPWTTLSDNIPDTLYRVHVNRIGTYYYRVRARRDNIWWDYSAAKKVRLGSDREITFRVDMKNVSLTEGETVGVRGNIDPLSGIESLGPFEDTDGDGIYQYTVKFDFDHVGETLIYRFTIDSAGVLKKIEGKNREYVITSDVVQILPVVAFDDLSKVEAEEIPRGFKLLQNYPNPFGAVGSTENFETRISFSLSESFSKISLKVYDLLGREVAVLKERSASAGMHEVKFNARNLPAGIYFYRLSCGGKSLTKKMILIK